MRPKKTNKPEGAGKFRHTARITPRVRIAAKTFSKDPQKAAHEIAMFVIKQIPINTKEKKGVVKRTVFKRKADTSLRKIEPASELHCAARSNLAIAIFNARGQPSWLVREINYSAGFKDVRFHDYVETMLEGRLHTLVFGKNSFFLLPGSANKVVPFHNNENFVYLRGADTRQIGGVRSWKEYENFIKRFKKDRTNELIKNERRLTLLVDEGVIPARARLQTIMEG